MEQEKLVELIVDLISAMKKHKSFLLNFTPIHNAANTDPEGYFKDAIAIACINKENTASIAVSTGYHFRKVERQTEFLEEMARDILKNEDLFLRGCKLGSDVADTIAQPDAFIQYREAPSTSDDSIDIDPD
jgi:hypothetical protein